MAITALNTIKNWFKTGLKPTQAQFWATWDSFWHKDQSIPQANITNLEQDLLLKQDKEGLHAVATSGDYNDLENLPGNIEEVNTYEDIPAKTGNYMFSQSASIDLLTNVARLDDSPIFLTELIYITRINIDIVTVVRDYVYTSEDRGNTYKYYIDTFYAGDIKLGYSRVTYLNDALDSNSFMLNVEDAVLNTLFHEISFQVYYSSRSRYYWLNLKGKDIDVNNNIIKTNVQFSSGTDSYFFTSHIFINNLSLDSYEVGLDYDNFVSIIDNSVQLIKTHIIHNIR